MRAVLVAGLVAALAVAGCTDEIESGHSSYKELCSGCHGDDGRGNGPVAGLLSQEPADLTMIASRNGGVFPVVEVMTKIHGYARGEEPHGSTAMPAFWPLLEGRTVLVQTGEGVLTPTPQPLVALTSYLESIQEQAAPKM